MFQTGTEETPCLFKRPYTAFNKQRGYNAVNPQFSCKSLNIFYFIVLS